MAKEITQREKDFRQELSDLMGKYNTCLEAYNFGSEVYISAFLMDYIDEDNVKHPQVDVEFGQYID